MALVISDRVKETTATSGTGTYTLGGAVTGFETFTANLSDGDTTYYACTDNTDFEVGLGTFTTSGTTLARTTILASSNSGSAVNWAAGTRTIFCTLPAAKAVFLDASNVTNISNLKLASGTTVTAILDEDGLSSDSATSLATQQSIKAYVDAQVTAQDLDFQGDTGGALSIDLDSETLDIAGGTGIDTSGSSNTLTVAIDSTVATLSGTQTLTNKILTSPVLNTSVSGSAFLDDDTFATATASSLASSESIKAYVDAQVATVDTLSEVLANGDTTGGNNISFGDSAAAGTDDTLIFGADNDFQIYHDGSANRITGSGSDGEIKIQAHSLQILDNGGNVQADFSTNGSETRLFYIGAQKLTTTTSGVDITGSLDVTDASTTRTNIGATTLTEASDEATALAIALG